MKKFAFLALIALSLSSYASSNLFECTGDGLKLTFATSSFIGKPTLNLETTGKTFHFSGEAIAMKTTSVGTLVEAQSHTEHLKFFIPQNDTQFTMVATLRKGPSTAVQGLHLTCTGQKVFF